MRVDCAAAMTDEWRKAKKDSMSICFDDDGTKVGPEFVKNRMADVVIEPSKERLEARLKSEQEQRRMEEMERERQEANKKSDQEIFEERLFNRDILQKVAEEMKVTIQECLEENAPTLIEESETIQKLQEEIERVKEMRPQRHSHNSSSDEEEDEDDSEKESEFTQSEQSNVESEVSESRHSSRKTSQRRESRRSRESYNNDGTVMMADEDSEHPSMARDKKKRKKRSRKLDSPQDDEDAESGIENESVRAERKSSRREKVGSTSRERKAVTILDPASGVSSRVASSPRDRSPKRSHVNSQSPEGLKKQKSAKKDKEIDLTDFSKKFEAQLLEKITETLKTYLKKSDFDKVIDKVDEQSQIAQSTANVMAYKFELLRDELKTDALCGKMEEVESETMNLINMVNNG